MALPWRLDCTAPWPQRPVACEQAAIRWCDRLCCLSLLRVTPESIIRRRSRLDQLVGSASWVSYLAVIKRSALALCERGRAESPSELRDRPLLESPEVATDPTVARRWHCLGA